MIQTHDDVRKARATLGLSAAQLARLLRMGHQAGRTIRRWESGQTQITGPAAVAIEAMLAGWRPIESVTDENP